MFTAKHGGRFDANQEFLALAASNLVAGIGRGFPIGGGSSQSLVNEGAGARTPLSSAFAALMMLMVVLFFTHLLSPLPQPVLAAVVLVAIAGLFKLSTLKELWRHDRGEFVVAMAAFLGVLTFGLLRGVLIGAMISLVQLLRRASRPHVAFLGRIPGARRYSDLERHPDNEPIPGLLLFRTEAGLFYFNADYVRDTVMKRVAKAGSSLRLAICDLSTSPYVDLTGAQMLAELHKELAAMNVRLQIVEARASVRDRLHTEGIEDKVGRIGRFKSLADAVDDFLKPSRQT
jgi:MFS superfamily sulfate permease-like transporter